MIAKRPRVRSVKGGAGVKLGGMKGLVQYVTRASLEGGEPLTQGVTITNSSADTTEDFLIQVDLVQRRSRSRQPKVYHLVVSFPAHEHPSPKVLSDIEQTLCEAIHAGEHQRLSVVHDDTDCLHLHIAINRVHPKTYTLNSIHKDYAGLQAACEQLEAKHGLSRTNHEMTRRASEDRARSVKLHHGETPLLERAQAMAEPLLAVQSWEELHAQLGEHGMTLRQRGAGLVIVAGEVGVKASSVAKGLSLGKLQARLGPFQLQCDSPGTGRRRDPDAGHDRKGSRGRGRPDAYSDLRRQFQSERAATVSERQETWGGVRQARAAAMQAVRAVTMERLARLEAIAPGPARWALSAAVREEQASHVSQVRAEASERVAHARRRLAARPPTSWIDWLRARAAGGDEDALAILRRSGDAVATEGGSWIAGGQDAGDVADPVRASSAQAPWKDRLRHVSRRGVVIYEIDRTRLRDDGDRLHLQGRPSDAAIAVALQLAKERHGSRLNVQGELALRSRIAHVAAQIDPSLRFDDAKTERLRAASVLVQQERRDGDTQGRGPGRAGQLGPEVRGRSARSRVGARGSVHVTPAPDRGAGAGYSAAEADRATLALLRGHYPAGGIRSAPGVGDQPQLAAIAAPATASDRGAWPGRRLRDMPRLDLVRRPEHGALPLPSPGGRDLGDRPVAAGDLAVRRPGAGDRAGAAATPGSGGGGLTAVAKYVAERNMTRARVSGLEPHRPFTPVPDALTYVGRRVVDGQPLALLRASGEVLVMEVHPDQHARIGRFKMGQGVEVRDGRITSLRSANTPQHGDDTPTQKADYDRGGRLQKKGSTR